MDLALELFSGADDTEVDLYAKEAPELPPDLDWLNVDRPLTLSQLHGKVVLVDALPLEMPVTFQQGQGELVGDLFLGCCRTGQEGICLLEQVRLRVPVTVSETGEPALRIAHRVTLPGFGDQ